MSDQIARTSATVPALPSTAVAVSRTPGYWSDVARRLRRDPGALICAAILLLILIALLAAPWLAPYNPYTGSALTRLKPIGTPGHPLGTDELGRDMLARLLYGGRLSWFLGLVPVAVAFVLGSLLGIIAGYSGGRINMLIMRATDIFYAFPSVLLAVAISGALGGGIIDAMLSMTIVFLPPIIRIAESVTAGVASLDYVEAARSTGAGPMLVARVHVLPNVLGPIFVYATNLISMSMILAAGLSFLGLGVQPPQAEWGLMLSSLRTAIYLQPLVTMLPGICIFITSICFNLLSDDLRAAMDVKV